VRPNEFLGDRVLRHCAQLIEEWTLFKLYVQAVGEADIILAKKRCLVDSEWEVGLAATVFEAREGSVSYFLGEPERQESLFNFALLVH
jgi:hypothetical protein